MTKTYTCRITAPDPTEPRHEPIRILLTTTSYQDTPGPHHDLLESTGWEIVRERGPLPEAKMLELAGDFDAFLCGDDAITRAVIEKVLPRLKIISQIRHRPRQDRRRPRHRKWKSPSSSPPASTTRPSPSTPSACCSASTRHLVKTAVATRSGDWKRLTGHEIMGKTIGIIGLGRIGKEVAIRANAFGMTVIAYDLYWDEEFAAEHERQERANMDEVLDQSDVVSLHSNLTRRKPAT